MINIQLRVSGTGLDIAKIMQIADKKKADMFLEALVEEAAELMRRYAPRDKGKLEGAIKVSKVREGEYIIYIAVPYAKFLEFGTRYIEIGTVQAPKAVISASGKQSYRPFARPAVWEAVERSEQLLKEIYDLD